ncbi:16S rRNA (guanine(527)-N(7))-methyltransferase RsmG [Taibaiella soli]|uniref:Ribosomal RNA small subunit methyltransferase G n=1 Tax=Taibaiella soli TaxID=1649169 RepID=A0A2W2BTH0_9BACT|nr:16S rRNA (guanine(527)-N(7))-methyltransferase RsmG [Taibaiella soli]PZF71083.1 16S rRNA (guanine(527)-N(7))-methyltransferase RsmG [Taibaiella soli]
MEIIQDYFSDFTETQTQQFQQLQALYTEWNEKINVISRKDIDSLYEKHVLHSLAIAAICNFHKGAHVVDIGTGGGFPGIPLAIFFPEVEFLLVDSIGKKIKVVEEVASAIGLKNVKTMHGRVENTGQIFDFAVSRAVAPLGELWGWIRNSLRKGRMSDEFANGLICLKGGDLTEEVKQSGLRPHLFPISEIFDEPSFETKYVVYVPR